MTLQQQVQQHLTDTGISLRELARQAFVSHTTIGKLLNGKPPQKASTKQKLIEAMQPKTLDATVEQLAAQCIDSDLTHVRDDALECGKQRRIAALEAEVSVWRGKEHKACEQAHNLQDVLAQRERHLKSCENALIEANEKIQNVLDESGKQLADLSLQLYGANAEIKRLAALSETHGQSWKAASVQVEQLETQLDRGLAQFKSLHDAYNQQVDDEREMLARIDTLFAERANMRTEHDQQVMRLRVYVWILICAIVFVVASGLVVWGGV